MDSDRCSSAARSRIHRRVLGPVLAAVADYRTPPALDRLVGRFDRHVDRFDRHVGRFDRHVDRLWQGRKTAA